MISDEQAKQNFIHYNKKKNDLFKFLRATGIVGTTLSMHTIGTQPLQLL